jgi:hypothetical protein
MALQKPLVDDREQIPALDEDQLIQIDETRLAKLGQSVVAVIGVILAGVLGFVRLQNDDVQAQNPGLVLLGVALVVAVSILAWSIVAAADLRARGAVTAANLALRARPSLTIAPAGATGGASGLWCHIEGRESGDFHLVVDSREVSGKTEYLLARDDERPKWYKFSDIDRWTMEPE